MTAVEREQISGAATGTRLASLLAAADDTLTVEAGGLATWPDGSVGRIPVTINQGQPDEERLYATGKAGDVLTGLLRGQDGTAAQSHVTGATVTHGLFATHIAQANELLSMPTAAGQMLVSSGEDEWGLLPAGVLGGILTMGDDGPEWGQTLDHPTLLVPTIDDFTDAGHDHLDDEGGGTLPVAAIPPLAAAWTPFTPVLTSDGTAPNLGADGIASGHYIQIGKTVLCQLVFRFSGAGVSPGTGTLYFASLPVNCASRPLLTLGSGVLTDVSAGRTEPVAATIGNTTKVVLNFSTAASPSVAGPAAPWAWADGDSISLVLTYEAA